MKHHFGDLLDRSGGYWTMVPNRERYAYRPGETLAGCENLTVVTIGQGDENWQQVLRLPKLQEVTLHGPTLEQMEAVGELRSLKRLRITHVRPRNIEFIRSMKSVEELILEYVSGFSDLSPLRSLKRLRALHLENLRRVSNFGGLSGIKSLKYLSILGTFDWKQPIEDFEFLQGLPSLEVLALSDFRTEKKYPAMLPAIHLKKLKKLSLVGGYLPIQEYALLEIVVKGVNWAARRPYYIFSDRWMKLDSRDIRSSLPLEVLRKDHPEVDVDDKGKRSIEDPAHQWYEFIGRGDRRVKCGSAKSEAKVREYVQRYEEMKEEARVMLKRRGLI